MKRSLLFVLLLSLNGTWVSAQVREEWDRGYHGPGTGDDYANAITVDSEGNIYVTGASFGTYPEYATLKYDPDGNLLWAARYHDAANAGDEAVAIALDAQSNIYVTGTICTQFRIIAGCIHWGFGTVKYNPQGRLLWVARYVVPGEDFAYQVRARAIAIDTEANVYVTGVNSPLRSQAEFATIKYDAHGRELWVAHYSGPAYYDEPQAIAVDFGGNVFVTGHSFDGPGSSCATIKYDPDGNVVWLARSAENYGASRLAIDVDGNIYVAAFRTAGGSALIKYDPDGNEVRVIPNEATARDLACDGENVYITGYGRFDETQDGFATFKYDSDGNPVWAARYHGPATGFDYAVRMTLDPQGNTYVTGSSHSAAQRADFTTIKYDPQGNEVWVARGSGPLGGYDDPRAIALDAAGNVYVTGRSLADGDHYQYLTIKYSQ